MKSRGFALQIARSLAAILVGNLLYLLLMPHLPVVMQHRLYTMDFGLVVDFCLCVLVWGLFCLLTSSSMRRQ
jgi:hypothetical protein